MHLVAGNAAAADHLRNEALAGGIAAGRIAASLLVALELPELVTTTLEDYEELAVALALTPGHRDCMRHCKPTRGCVSSTMPAP